MSNALYLDCHAGIAGDMLLSALIDLGADAKAIETQLQQLPIDDFNLHFTKKVKQGIHAMTLTIDFNESHHHRTASDILTMIEESPLPERVKMRSKSIFMLIAQAEAKIHGMTVEDVHFHEVGAMDSIIDIIGGCLALEQLNIDTIYCSPIPTGHGKIKIAHGIYPIPAPATAELLTGIPLAAFDVESELTTPTGAAFAKSLSDYFGPMPNITIDKIGYGAGTKDFDFPNVLRVIQFQLDEDQTPRQVQVLECQIDDMSAEMLGHFMQLAFDNQALDVYYTPIVMKKQRPAVKLTVICNIEDKSMFETLILTHTSSLGVRSYTTTRRILTRKFETINTQYGQVTVKLALSKNTIIKAKPEYEDIKQISEQHQLPLSFIYNDVMSEIMRQFDIAPNYLFEHE